MITALLVLAIFFRASTVLGITCSQSNQCPQSTPCCSRTYLFLPSIFIFILSTANWLTVIPKSMESAVLELSALVDVILSLPFHWNHAHRLPCVRARSIDLILSYLLLSLIQNTSEILQRLTGYRAESLSSIMIMFC